MYIPVGGKWSWQLIPSNHFSWAEKHSSFWKKSNYASSIQAMSEKRQLTCRVGNVIQWRLYFTLALQAPNYMQTFKKGIWNLACMFIKGTFWIWSGLRCLGYNNRWSILGMHIIHSFFWRFNKIKYLAQFLAQSNK